MYWIIGQVINRLGKRQNLNNIRESGLHTPTQLFLRIPPVLLSYHEQQGVDHLTCRGVGNFEKNKGNLYQTEFMHTTRLTAFHVLSNDFVTESNDGKL